MSEKKEGRKIDIRKGSKLCKCILTAEELLEFGAQMADHLSSITRIEDDKKAAMEDFKSQLSLEEASASRCGRLVRERYEMRYVDIETGLDYDSGTVVITRMDTGEVIESRAMRDDERQMDIGIDE